MKRSQGKPSHPALAPVARAAALVALLAALLVSGAHAQGVSATSPTNDLNARSWVHESWTVKDGLPVNSINAHHPGPHRLHLGRDVRWARALRRASIHRLQLRQLRGAPEQPDHRVEGGARRVAVARHRAGSHRSLPRRAVHQRRIRKRESERKACRPRSSTRRASSGWGRPRDCGRSGATRLVRVGRERSTRASPPSCSGGTEASGSARSAPGSSGSRGDSRVTKVVADPALDADFIWSNGRGCVGHALDRGNASALVVARPAGASAKGLRPPHFVETFVQVPRDRRRVCRSRVRRVPDRFRLGRSGTLRRSVSTGLRLWADADAIWTVDGQDVLRDGRRVFTLPERRIVSAALFDREGSLWLGTDAGGLHRLKPALFTTYSVPEGSGTPERLRDVRGPLGCDLARHVGEGCEPHRPRHRSRDGSWRGDDSVVRQFLLRGRAGALWIASGVGVRRTVRVHAARDDVPRRGSRASSATARCSRSTETPTAVSGRARTACCFATTGGAGRAFLHRPARPRRRCARSRARATARSGWGRTAAGSRATARERSPASREPMGCRAT